MGNEPLRVFREKKRLENRICFHLELRRCFLSMKPCKYLPVLIQKLQTEIDVIYHQMWIIQHMLINLHGDDTMPDIKENPKSKAVGAKKVKITLLSEYRQPQFMLIWYTTFWLYSAMKVVCIQKKPYLQFLIFLFFS